ncbi:glycine betaine ABC transporter substrate-binding protein [Fusibacter sp. A1]|uniref:ABC transporter substrate-binding protein n=1 Tax=Fusibacter sp. A2 TaxID=2929473 RepID=UPI00210F6452|nr:glycine betaine ABC transporter substrate-binding protein [Fusibacter sp. A1]
MGVQETFDYVKSASEEKDGITWLKPLGWNNTYVLSVRPETAETFNLTNISDLVAVSGDMILGSDDEFINRMDGLIGLKELYLGLDFSKEVSMDQSLTYSALKDSKIDVNTSYSTDGRIAKFGLVNLVDDKNFFPPYYVTPILKMEFANENPEVVKALEELGGHWTEAEMQVYNLMVDEGDSARDVATLMLTDAGLLEK